MSDDLKQIGRLAFRHEGANWNAYYAMPDSMADAVPIGSIRMGAVLSSLAIKQAFMDLGPVHGKRSPCLANWRLFLLRYESRIEI